MEPAGGCPTRAQFALYHFSSFAFIFLLLIKEAEVFYLHISNLLNYVSAVS